MNALRGLIIHFNNQCWIKNTELQVKYSLRQMRPQGSKRSLREVATTEPNEENRHLPQNLRVDHQRYFGWRVLVRTSGCRLGLRRSCMQQSICDDRNKNWWTYVGRNMSGERRFRKRLRRPVTKYAKRLLPPEQPMQSCHPWVAFFGHWLSEY